MITEITSDAQFLQELSTPRNAVVVFKKANCPGCRYLMPKVEAMAQTFPRAPVLRIDTDLCPLAVQMWGVQTVPSVKALVQTPTGPKVAPVEEADFVKTFAALGA